MHGKVLSVPVGHIGTARRVMISYSTRLIHTIICRSITRSVISRSTITLRNEREYRVELLYCYKREQACAEWLAPTPTTTHYPILGRARWARIPFDARRRGRRGGSARRAPQVLRQTGGCDGGRRGASGGYRTGSLAGRERPREAPTPRWRRWPSSWPPWRRAAEARPRCVSGGAREAGGAAKASTAVAAAVLLRLQWLEHLETEPLEREPPPLGIASVDKANLRRVQALVHLLDDYLPPCAVILLA